MRRAVAAALVIALAAPAAPVDAGKKPSRKAMKEAREHFRRGQQLHDAGRYDDAIREYETAYEISRLPDLLYNIGQVHRLKGDRRTAVVYYRRYVDAAPDGPGAPKAREFLGALTRELEAQEEAERSLADDAIRGTVLGAALLVRDVEPPSPVAFAPAPIAEEPIVDRGATMRTAGLVTGGAGVLVLGAGVFFGLRARSLSDELAAVGPGDEWDPSLVDDGHVANRNALICFSVGGAALLTGGVLYWLGARRRGERRVVVVPAATPDAASIVLGGQF